MPNVSHANTGSPKHARERILKLADPDTFLEIGTFVTTPTKDGSPLGVDLHLRSMRDRWPSCCHWRGRLYVEGGGTGVHLEPLRAGGAASSRNSHTDTEFRLSCF
ncbi:hypothetical protein F2981_21175 (plasmid) [Sinorhizobium meliloti]|nr:hypothetical protein [Sinorhizobium meliloti]